MAKENLTWEEKVRLCEILNELEGARESVRNSGGYGVDEVERWKKHLFEEASEILGERHTRYFRTVRTIKGLGIGL